MNSFCVKNLTLRECLHSEKNVVTATMKVTNCIIYVLFTELIYINQYKVYFTVATTIK